MTAPLLIALVVIALANLTMAVFRRRLRAKGHARPHSLHYRLYIGSALWRVRRRIWIAQAHGRCQGCGRRQRPLTIHHLTYARLGHERRSDIQVLCWGCHQARHGAARRPIWREPRVRYAVRESR